MPLLADNRIPDTTLPDNQFQDGDIFYGDDANKVSDTLKAGVNANYNDIKRLANGELGTVIQPDGSIKYIRLNQDGVLEVSTDNLNYVTTSYAIQDEEGNIANHRPYLYFEGAYVVDNGARIEIHGFQGEQGLTGPQGEQGVQGERGPAGTSSAVAPQAGFYSLQMESNGDLYVVYPDDETAPTFQYEKETGNLYVVLDGQEVLVGNVAGPQGDKGDTGDRGEKGDPGFSPTVSTETITNGVRVTITDESGPHSFDIENGAGIPDGGTQGQFLRKTANSTEWANVINDEASSIITTYSSNKVDSLVDGIIADSSAGTGTTWSSQKIQNQINLGDYEIIEFNRIGSITPIDDNTFSCNFNQSFKDGDNVIFLPIAFGDGYDVDRMENLINLGGFIPKSVTAGTTTATFICPNQPTEGSTPLIGGFIFRKKG